MINIITYGTKYGEEPGLGVVWKCTTIKNPYTIPRLKVKTGLDKEVQDFVLKDIKSEDIIQEALKMVGCGTKILGFKCLGGKHRSVAIAEITADRLRFLGYEVEVNHRDI